MPPPTLQELNIGFPRYCNKKQTNKENNNKQKFNIKIKANMKASEIIIDCTYTVASISSISWFACANV